MNYYPYLISVHIIFIVTWFAALFYIVRLFIYHKEAMDKPEPERSILTNQFAIMEKRLMNIIGTPSMILVLITGVSLLGINNQFIYESWMQLKLFFVLCLIVYHFSCLRIMKKLALGQLEMTSEKLRVFNELTTIILFAIVFLVELKNLADMGKVFAGLILLAIALMIAIKMYKRARKN